MRRRREAEPGKVIGDARKETDALDVVLAGFAEQRLHHPPPRAPPLPPGVYGDRAHLGQVGPVEVQRAAGDHLAAVLDHGEVADVFGNLRQRPRQEDLLGHVGRHQRVDARRVRQPRFTRAHWAPSP
ncbi:MAG: hypothetical protein A2620_08155 [Acidobacteria bacterium RIFCSPHIGHO2_01_FULL_67_28]|nr:MAG: hypothetical protein A2620_08155 [Acidobacteria bacterium RIFCSPHIGHO2_01_FULL_67_28]